MVCLITVVKPQRYSIMADLLTTQKILGHASVVTTQGYTHIAVKKVSEDYQKFHPAVQNYNLYISRNHPLRNQPRG